MGWFGPKGVATMAFSLLVLGDAIPGNDRIFNIAALAVFCSIILHGLSDTPGANWLARRSSRESGATPQAQPDARGTASTGSRTPLSRRRPARDQRKPSPGARSLHLRGGQRAAGPGVVADPAGDVDRTPVPVAGPADRLAGGDAGAQLREVLALGVGEVDRSEHRVAAAARSRSETSIAASPIIFTSRTGSVATSAARSPSRPATAPSSDAGTRSPRRVKPTRSAKHTAISRAPPRRPSASAAPAEHGLAQHLELVQQEHVVEQRDGDRGQLRRPPPRSGEPDSSSVSPGTDERLGEHPAHRGGDAGHALARDADDLEHSLLGHPGVEGAPDQARAASTSASLNTRSPDPTSAMPMARHSLPRNSRSSPLTLAPAPRACSEAGRG